MSYQLFTDSLEAWSGKYHGHKFHAVLCDPPYGLKFMGKDWDVVSSKAWGQALLPHLYPGALVLMFGGTRTWHKLATGMEDAGFQIWDTLMWLYGQGFPKAQDISKLIDKQDGRIGRNMSALKGTLKSLFKSKGFTQATLDEACGFSAWSYTSERHPWNHVLPDSQKWAKLKEVLDCGDELDETFSAANREITGKSPWSNSANHFVPGEDHTERVTLDVTAPGSSVSAPWAGHKTCALKPAWEPILAFRVPSKQPYAELALEYGSGALNIDAGRVAVGAGGRPHIVADYKDTDNNTWEGRMDGSLQGGSKNAGTFEQGRYPANLLLDDTSAALLDAQTGVLTSGKPGVMRKCVNDSAAYGAESRKPGTLMTGPGDSGGASRFFYCAKASSSERNAGCEALPKKEAGLHDDDSYREPGERKANHTAPMPRGNHHPTVKPLALTEYLAKLLLPPDSVHTRRLLVPFAGSGSEMVGALRAGWDEVVGIEQEPDYSTIAEARLAHMTAFTEVA